MSTPIAKKQTQSEKERAMSPTELMAYRLRPRKLTGFDRCFQSTTASRLQPARGWVRTA